MPSSETIAPKPSRFAQIRTGLLLMLGAIAVLWIIVEVIFRTWFPQPGGHHLRIADPEYHHVLAPNRHVKVTFKGTDYVMDVRTNADGFRDDPFDPNTREGIRILFVGDSFSFGWGVNLEERQDKQLAEILRQHDLACSTTNASVPGWATLQEERLLRNRLEYYDPDVVVLTFCGNDLTGDLYTRLDPEYAMPDCLRTPVLRFFHQRSQAFRYFQTTLFRYWRLSWFKRTFADHIPLIDSIPHFPQPYWIQTLELIQSMHDQVLDYNPRALFLLNASGPLDPDTIRYLPSLSNGTTLQYIDTLEGKEEINTIDLHLTFDGHWNPMMHRLSAEALVGPILDYAQENGFRAVTNKEDKTEGSLATNQAHP